ncbi:MAG: hypothetical protein KH745_05280 [Bilophila sp.]|nr:hypothetical protein [Bilophila sp.]
MMKTIRLLVSVAVDGALTVCSCGGWLGLSQEMGGTFTQREMEHQHRVEREKVFAENIRELRKMRDEACFKK